MENLFEIKTYSYFPNMKKMNTIKSDHYDFIVTCFELSVPSNKIVSKYIDQVDSLYLFSYLFVDAHDNQININFEILSNDYEVKFDEFKKRSKDTKKTVIIDNYDKVLLKQTNLHLDFSKAKNFSDILSIYKQTDILPSLLSMKKFMDDNSINYCPEEFNKFLKSSKKEINKIFSEKYIAQLMPNNINQINSILFFHDLNNTIQINTQSQLVKKNKI